MSDFKISGTVSSWSELRPIRTTDIYNQDPDNFGYETGGKPIKDRFRSILVVNMNSKDFGAEDITISMYDDWAEQCQFLTVGDTVTLTISPELVKYRDRDETHCIALHVDEGDEEAIFILVKYDIYHQHMQYELSSHQKQIMEACSFPNSYFI